MKTNSFGIIGQIRRIAGLSQSELADILMLRRSYLAQIECGSKHGPYKLYDTIGYLIKTMEYGKQNFETELNNSVKDYPDPKTLRKLKHEIHHLENYKLPKLLFQQQKHLEREEQLKNQYYMFCLDDKQNIPSPLIGELAPSKRIGASAELTVLGKHNLWILESEIDQTRMSIQMKKALLERLESI